MSWNPWPPCRLFAMNVQLRPDVEGPGPYSMFVELAVR